MSAWIADFLDAEGLPDGYAQTIASVWTPLAQRIATAAGTRGPAHVVGLCGAQGSGKSTACAVLQRLLQAVGLSVATLSIDDLYLTRAERLDLARTVHPLLATRGPPGTHDVALGEQVLDDLARAGEITLPRFDKGRDDRAPRATWPHIQGPADVVLFEGWCVGARAQAPPDIAAPINALERDRDANGAWRTHVNVMLAGPYQRLFARLDRLVLLQAPSFETVLAWRLEQEHKLRDRMALAGADTSRILADAEVATFIAHYERLTRHILAEMPARADDLVVLDDERQATLT